MTAGTGEPGDDAVWMTVVGVTRDVKHYGVDEPMRPGVYQPFRQLPRGGGFVALRVSGDSEPVLSAARALTAETDSELPIYAVNTMRDQLDEALWSRRASSWMIAAFSTVALLLSIAGIYGVISYSVGQGRQEIGIRMAMGAERRDVLGQVVRQGMLLVAAGAVAGPALAYVGADIVSGILVGVSARDPSVYLAVTLVLVAVAAAANYVPARRASRLDPMRVLRNE